MSLFEEQSDIDALENSIAYRDGYPILSVSDLVEGLKGILKETFPFVWIQGEIGSFKMSNVGHAYFTLKDVDAQIQCACFRPYMQKVRFDVNEGQAVLVGAEIDVYSARGQLQAIARVIEPQGVGALALAFEQLKQKLDQDGLFDPDYKVAIPQFPQKVAVVTSPTGAVIRDILNVSGRRYPQTQIVVIPSRVQGDEAEAELVAGIEKANQLEVDVIIVARGGGSLEDLWPFNSEAVARAIFASQKPVVSAVGHETDFTIADFVADLRAPTPSAAAELVFPNRLELENRIHNLQSTMTNAILDQIQTKGSRLNELSHRLKSPQDLLEQRLQQLDYLNERLLQWPKVRWPQYGEQLANLAHRMRTSSPLKVLERGFSVVTKQGKMVQNVDDLKAKDSISIRMQNGQIEAVVKEVQHES